MDTIELAVEHVLFRGTPEYDKSAAGLVYLLRCGETPFHKIGFTRHSVAERASQIGVTSPLPVQVVGAVGARMADERALHGYLQPYRTNGEWFWIEPGQVRDAVYFWFDAGTIH
jgi:hypothetical protein